MFGLIIKSAGQKGKSSSDEGFRFSSTMEGQYYVHKNMGDD